MNIPSRVVGIAYILVAAAGISCYGLSADLSPLLPACLLMACGLAAVLMVIFSPTMLIYQAQAMFFAIVGTLSIIHGGMAIGGPPMTPWMLLANGSLLVGILGITWFSLGTAITVAIRTPRKEFDEV